MTNKQENFDEGRIIVDRLLVSIPVPFLGPTVDRMPEKSGIYLFFNRITNEFLYIGKSHVGLKKRMIDHWYGTDTSDLGRILLDGHVVRGKEEARNWIKENVSIRWLTSGELDKDIEQAESLAITELRPQFNRRIP